MAGASPGSTGKGGGMLLTFALRRMFENPNVGQVEIVTRSTQADNALSEVGFEVIRSTALYRIVPRLTHLQ
jgi:hypothetical protein